MLLKKNFSIFFLGIGGISVSSLAFFAKKAGCRVAGYDATLTPLTDQLEKSGIPVYNHFDKKHYENVDLVVYSAAIHADDVVRSYPGSLGIPEMTRAEFLGLLMKQKKNPVGVAGTHGKSTTTGMLASVFTADPDRSPTVMAGAELPSIGSAYQIGEGEDFLFEACEYQNSFLRFFPHLAIILNAEHDHADFFPTKEDVIRSFVAFADLARDGRAIINFDNEGARRVAQQCQSPVFFFSAEEKKDLWCEDLSEKNGFYSFKIFTREGLYTDCTLSVPGYHNVLNALAAASAAYLSGIKGDRVKMGLERFCGVRRRFEYRGKCNQRVVFDDYAHHPDEIFATLTAARKMGYDKICVVFQSHTFTRTQAYFDDFIRSLSLADEVIFADIYPAREKPIPGICAEKLALASKNGKYLGSFEDIAAYLKSRDESGLLIVMGAGDIVQLTDRILTEEPTQ